MVKEAVWMSYQPPRSTLNTSFYGFGQISAAFLPVLAFLAIFGNFPPCISPKMAKVAPGGGTLREALM